MNPLWQENIVKDYRGTHLKCSNCSLETPIRNAEKCVVFFCPKCKWIYAKENQNYNKLSKNKKEYAPILIPLQSKGVIDDVTYTVTGCVHKFEKGDRTAKWEEYTLIDDKGNCAYLSQSFGHWIFLKERSKPLNFEGNKTSDFLDDDGEHYEFFTSYYQMSVTAAGEFQDDVINVKNRFTREFISPPYLFSHELHGNENTYLQGHYLTASQITKYFKEASLALPFREGVGSCQPFYFGIRPRRFFILSVLLVALSLPFYMALVGNSSQPAMSLEGRLTDTIRSQQLISQTFNIDGSSKKMIRVDSKSNISNDWIEAQITLVNEESGEERSFVSGLEYYSGYDDGGAWSEGESAHSNYLSSIEPGKYHIEANFFGSSSSKYTNFNITAFVDSPTSWNYFLLVLSLLIICVLIGIVNNGFENKRLGITDDE